MATEEFALLQGWRITHWQVTTRSGPIPEDAFVVGGTLLVGISKQTFPPVYSLAWLDGSHRWSSISGLDLSDQADTLAASDVQANIGPAAIKCYVQVQLSAKDGVPSLVGEIKIDPFSTGNAGSFAAEAHIPPFPGGEGMDRR